MKIPYLLIPLFLSAFIANAQDVPYPDGARDVVQPFVHDPVIIQQGAAYYMFNTGPGITNWRSTDLVHWSSVDPVFPEIPQWMHDTVPGFTGHLWAPDISYHDGWYYLYYSVSAFGKNTSCIGLAMNRTLDPEDPNYRWEDRGIILQSHPGLHNWNAIDPNVIEDSDGTPYLSFGSFWDGLFLIQLSQDRMSLAVPEDQAILIATRVPVQGKRPEAGFSEQAGVNAIEAPFIWKRGEYFYLFASFDYCCRGSESDYKVVVGRSRSLVGPYLDGTGKSMLAGGGTLFIQGGGRWHGAGHNAIFLADGQEYVVYHAYDSKDHASRARLMLEPLTWDWPVITPTQR
jgi:arabinan endo-1,5-alpha-L-arabinosidase